jgi:hypothetical protein
VQFVNVADPANLLPAGSLPGFALDVDDALLALFIAVDDVLAIGSPDCANIAVVAVSPEVVAPAARVLTAHPNPFNPARR